MNKQQDLLRIKELQQEILKHDNFYAQNQPIITDGDYDKLYFELLRLEAQYPESVTVDSPTQRIIDQHVNETQKSRHNAPIISQQKANTIEELITWVRQCDGLVKNNSIVVQHKLDGLTIVLTYDDGKLVKAVTRGDGEIGEIVTHNAYAIRNIPKRINFKKHLEIRGEAILNYEDFDRINVDGKYASPRNLAAGTIAALDSKVCSERNVRFIAFDVVSRFESLNHEHAAMKFLKELGFTTVPTILWEFEQTTSNECLSKLLSGFTQKIGQERSELDYMIDGVIFKFNNLALQDELGYTRKYPRFGIAFKFESEDAITTLRSVTVQLGRNGFLTPVANFDKICIGGVEIEKATLHNYKNIEDKDIRIGDKILVARANDVIPKVIKSFHELRTGKETKVEIPSVCPICGGKVTASEGQQGLSDSLLVCENPDCEGKSLMKLIYFASRPAMNIDTLGEAVMTKLYEEGIVRNITDLYTNIQPNRDVIANFDKYGKKKVNNLIQAIEASKTVPLSNFLAALSIRNVGVSTAKDIAKEFNSMDGIKRSLSEGTFKNRLLTIDGIADTVLNTCTTYFENQDHIDMINKLMSFGFTLIEDATNTKQSDKLAGKTFVITGKLSKARDEFVNIIELNGGKVSGSVSKKTSYLLLGEGEENSSKYQKAKALNIEILFEDDFNNMLT